ncbi:MAG: hypothetical protein B6I23_02460 [Rickettsiaceae bacterium 4572_127]|nr:MAG: hypothetical protein B6I23_02460 [Rickettsiaceae bacterium 4572_127]
MHCGLDFGTSNTVAGVLKNDKVHFVKLEGKSQIIPTSIFFNYETQTRHFGQNAIDLYVSGTEGRLLRSLKSLLGTSLIKEKTKMQNNAVAFQEIIGIFLAHIKDKITQQFQEEVTSITIGRPVFFVDNNEKKDKEAEEQLRKIAEKVGFKNISFYYEPLSASLQYEQTISQEEIALIVDIGGGTADFSIVRLHSKNNKKILANSGVHIGGTDIDTVISLNEFMPLLGFQKIVNSGLKTPNHLYHDLSSWHRIQQLYSLKKQKIINELLHENTNLKEIKRLHKIVKLERGHDLLFEAENTKIKLGENNSVRIDLSLIEKELSTEIFRKKFNKYIEFATDGFNEKINETVKNAGLKKDEINTIFLTGGTTKIPFVKEEICAQFPTAKIIDNNTFFSVGEGLTLKGKD